jgi:hypothetical protein
VENCRPGLWHTDRGDRIGKLLSFQKPKPALALAALPLDLKSPTTLNEIVSFKKPKPTITGNPTADLQNYFLAAIGVCVFQVVTKTNANLNPL